MASVSTELSGQDLTETLTRYAPAVPREKTRRRAAARAQSLSKRKAAPPKRAMRPEPKEPRYGEGINWPVVGWVVLLHAGALAAPFFFTWQGLALLFVLHWFTGGIGICLGYHRLFTHRSFATYRPVEWLIAWIGGLAGEGSAIDWVANHRKHHALSDQEGDPHSPHDGAWWSHILWLAKSRTPEAHEAHIHKWAPDLAKDPMFKFLSSTFLLWNFVVGIGLFAVGYAMSGVYFGCSLMFWGLFLRLVLVMHATWFVNSASHMWGYVNYKTTDDSRNNWWVAIITYGEGWHNNHHAYPRMANHGHKWWEYDATFRAIRALQWLGLAWNVVDYKRKPEKLARGKKVAA